MSCAAQTHLVVAQTHFGVLLNMSSGHISVQYQGKPGLTKLKVCLGSIHLFEEKMD
jgi:hypothetical protein